MNVNQFLTEIPESMVERLKQCFQEDGTHNYQSNLSLLRLEFERFMHHLAILSKVKENEWQSQGSVNNKIQLLAGNRVGLLKEGMEHYLTFWYGLGCLGSHFGSITSVNHISLEHHFETCKNAMMTVILWYVKEFPRLSQKIELKKELQSELERFQPILVEQVVKPSSKNIYKLIEENDVLWLHGPSWIGKTSLSCSLVNEFCLCGYMPIIFHESNLLNPSLFYDKDRDNSEIKRLLLSDKAGVLHREIVTSIFRGDSYIILFDDPFGHRQFKISKSPLSYLRVSDWINLARSHTSLGRIKVIINTPTRFFNELKRISSEEFTPVLHENIKFLLEHKKNSIAVESLDLKDYSKEDLSLIISSVSSGLGGNWAEQEDVCELLATIISDSCSSFETLRLFCLESSKLLPMSDEFVENVSYYLENSSELTRRIEDTDSQVQSFIMAVVVGEAFEQLSRDYLYSKVSFSELCEHLKIPNLLLEDDYFKELSYWINFEFTQNNQNENFPQFRHPDLRAEVETFLTVSSGKKMMSDIIANSVFMDIFSCSQNASSIMRWESIYFVCRFASFLDEHSCQYIDANWLRISKAAFDYQNTLWAISDNWLYVKDTLFEPRAIATLQRIQNENHSLRRSFIWEIMNNWAHLNEKVRMIILKLNGQEKRGILEPKVIDEHLLSFLGAALSNYRTVSDLAINYESESSRQCLDFVNEFIRQLSDSKNINTPKYKSYEDDRVFSDRGGIFPGRDVLAKICQLGLDSGGLDESFQIVPNIYNAIKI
jgi:hypothetical protein